MTRRLYSASEVRSFARCPELWWYERRRADLVGLDAATLQRRRDLLRRDFGARAARLPEDRLLAQLLARREHLARGTAFHRAHEAHAVKARSGCLLPLVLTMILPCLAALMMRRFEAAWSVARAQPCRRKLTVTLRSRHTFILIEAMSGSLPRR
jgi:hypothetical protein